MSLRSLSLYRIDMCLCSLNGICLCLCLVTEANISSWVYNKIYCYLSILCNHVFIEINWDDSGRNLFSGWLKKYLWNSMEILYSSFAVCWRQQATLPCWSLQWREEERRRRRLKSRRLHQTTSNNIKEVLALYGMAHLCPQVINKVMMIHSMHKCCLQRW